MHHQALAAEDLYHQDMVGMCPCPMALTPLKIVTKASDPCDEEIKTTGCYDTAHDATRRYWTKVVEAM